MLLTPSSKSLFQLERAAELFGVLATPVRLRILAALKQGEQNVSTLLEKIDASQPNMSRHLSVMYRFGVLAKRREGQQIYYRIADESVVLVCEAMCSNLSQSKFELAQGA